MTFTVQLQDRHTAVQLHDVTINDFVEDNQGNRGRIANLNMEMDAGGNIKVKITVQWAVGPQVVYARHQLLATGRPGIWRTRFG